MRPLLRALLAIATLTIPGWACADDTRPPVASIEVCVREGRTLRAGTAEPSWAGVYDPTAPVQPELLNWTVRGVGCVTYPRAGAPRASCAPGAPRPIVRRTLCQQ